MIRPSIRVRCSRGVWRVDVRRSDGTRSHGTGATLLLAMLAAR